MRLGGILDRELMRAEMAGDEIAFLPETCGVGSGHLAIIIGNIGNDSALPALGAPKLRRDGKG